MADGAIRPIRVLVVDDSPAFQQSLATLLAPVPDVRIVGYATDAAGALAMVASQQPDLVLLDVALTGDDRGIDVLTRIVHEHPHIQVVVLSNFSWRAMRQVMLDAGARAYFDKGDEFRQARDWIAALARTRAAGCQSGTP